MTGERAPPEADDAAIDRGASTRTRAGEPATVATAPLGDSTAAPAPAPGVAHLEPGARVADRYVVIALLGGGGMGVVYRARDEKVVDREVALKMLRTPGHSGAARRMLREARAAGALDSARVAKLFDVGETPEGELFLVMEYVSGTTVRELLRRGRIERAEALRIVSEVAIALSDVHRAGFVHRDVKPDNVIVRDGGRVVLLDFGIAKQLARSEDAAQVSTQLTVDGAVMGTPAYLAPEQALGREVGPAADQFALAVMAYEMLTGVRPWTAKGMTELLAQLLTETPRGASAVDGSLPSAIDDVLWKGLAKAPGERFERVTGFAEALRDAGTRAEVVPATGEGSRGRRGRRWAALTLVGLSIAVAAAVAATGGRSRPKAAPEGEPVVALPVPSEVRLACPIFEVRGEPEVAQRLGAAAATIACTRAKWFVSGRDDRVLVPAALLDLPNQPMKNFPDPYAAPEQRARTVDAARARASLYLDGTIEHAHDGWTVQVAARTPEGREIARATGRDGVEIALAIKKAVEPLWSDHRLSAEPIDPDVSSWTATPDVGTGLVYADFAQMDATELCASVGKSRSIPEPASSRLLALCMMRGLATGVSDAGTPTLDESSGLALASSVFVLNARGLPIPNAKRVAERLESFRTSEPSALGRTRLAEEAGNAWFTAADYDRAHASALIAVREDPLLNGDWQRLIFTSERSGSSAAVATVAGAWFPNDPMFLQAAFSIETDRLARRLTQTRLAYLLSPEIEQATYLGRALAEAGRADEVRALALTPFDGELNQNLEALLLGLIDLHDGKLERALQRFPTDSYAMTDRTILAGVLGRSSATATAWATEFMSMPEADAQWRARTTVATIAICAFARRDLASKCLDRVDRLGHHLHSNWWGDGGDAFLRGAKRYAIGDARGAVAQWRPLVANVAVDTLRLLPTEAFERAGESDLAARLDDLKMAYRNIAGVSDASPRQAKRAFARGDRAKARELAQQVIDAWGHDDAPIPAVAEMRALLASLDK